MSKHGAISRYVAEMVGTFFLVYTVCCTIHVSPPGGGPLCVGAILMCMIYAVGPVSGAHLNPAVTLGVYLSGRNKITPTDVGMYIVSQLIGGSLAGIAFALFFHKAGVFGPVGTFSLGQAFVVEMIFTSALVYVVLSVATTNASNHYFGLAIGFTVTSSAVAIGGISGCCLNPAVAFGSLWATLIVHGAPALKQYPIYFVAPFVGSVLGALFFYFIRRKDEYEPLDIGLLKLQETVPSINSPTVSSGMSSPELAVADGLK